MRPIRALILIVAALAVAAPNAHADAFDTIFKDFKSDGQVDPCKYTAAQLQRARKDVPPDIEQYAPDFPDALDQAIEARARGRCDKTKKAAAPAPTQQDTLGTSTPEISKTTTGSTGPTG